MAELQRRAAMHAAQSQHSNPASIVAEHDHVFAENSSPLRFVLKLRLKTDRLPIAPQHLARRRARSHSREHFVFFFTQRHDCFPSESKGYRTPRTSRLRCIRSRSEISTCFRCVKATCGYGDV